MLSAARVRHDSVESEWSSTLGGKTAVRIVRV